MEKTNLSYLVSNFDIEDKFKGQHIKIVTYPELKDYSDITEIVPEEISACFILIKTFIFYLSSRRIPPRLRSY